MSRFVTLFFVAIGALTFIISTTGCKKETPPPNPFFTQWDTPYEFPPFDKIRPEHYKPAIERGIALHSAEIDSIVSNSQAPDFNNVIAAFDRSGELLDRAYATFNQILGADGSDELRQIELEIAPKVTAHYDSIYQNERLFARIDSVYATREQRIADPEQRRLTELIHKQFVRNGARLDPQKKKRFQEINQELSSLSIRFGNNLQAETKNFTLVIDSAKHLKGLPDELKNSTLRRGNDMGLNGKWVFTLDNSCLIPFLTHSEIDTLRKKMYTAYTNRGHNGNEYDNRQIVNDILRLRTEKAHLLGYPSYAAFVLDDRMAQNTEKVYGLLDTLWAPALELAKEELTEITSIKKTETGDSTVAAWDWWFYAEKLRRRDYRLDESTLMPYFALEDVKTGVFQLSNRLWGLSFRPISVPTYNTECFVYEVLDRNDAPLGVLNFDPYMRKEKRGGAWCGLFRNGLYATDSTRVFPIVTVVCNFTPPSGSQSPLLTLDETRTLFHEFGHALHKLFCKAKYNATSHAEWDFVELPSQIMENWATEPEVLRFYARNYQTGDPIPEHLIRKIHSSKSSNQGFATTELVAAALLDMDLHSITEYGTIDLDAFEQQALYEKRGLIPQIAPRYQAPYFAHIFDGGYAAGYYGYLWAEVLDKDAFQAFTTSGDLFDREVAQTFRNTILEPGGTTDGMTLFKNFMGREPQVLPMMVARGLAEPPAEDSTATAEAILPDSLRTDSTRIDAIKRLSDTSGTATPPVRVRP